MNFRNWILQNFPLLENDFDALTDYELFCKMLEYVKSFAKDNEEFKKQLETYENYFNNLDVQEEINNKLDEMASDGTLDEIIEQFINSSAIWGFDTVNEMKNATNLINGSYAKTLGYYEKNDGGKGFYKIRNATSNDVIDNGSIIQINNSNLIAELIPYNYINIEQFGAIGDNITDDSTYFQNALNFISVSPVNKIILGKNKKYYITNTLSIFSNTILDLNNSTIRTNNPHLFVNFKSTQFGWDSDDNYLEYNGNGNIIIKNGVIIGGSISFIHAKNITLKDLNLSDTYSNHYLEICACDGYNVLNCNFAGMQEQPSDRRYVEYIQLDPCNYTAFPWLNENSQTYDNTINKNIIIDKCSFKASTDTFNHLYTAIGNHLSSNFHHNNIVVKNCKIDGNEYYGIRFKDVDDIIIENNIITNMSSSGIGFDGYSNNVDIRNNTLEANRSGLSLILFYRSDNNTETTYNNIKILNNNLFDSATNRAIDVSGIDTLYVCYNITSCRYIVYPKGITNVTVSKNTNINPLRELSSFIPNLTANNNTFNYSDIKLKIVDTITTENNDRIITLTYPITSFNRLFIVSGRTNNGSYKVNEINSYENRFFQLGEKYMFSFYYSDGTIYTYNLEIDSNDPKLLRLTPINGTTIDMRDVYALSL